MGIIPTVCNQLPAFLPQRVEAVEVLWALLDEGLRRGRRLVLLILNIYHGLVSSLIVWLMDFNVDLKIFMDFLHWHLIFYLFRKCFCKSEVIFAASSALIASGKIKWSLKSIGFLQSWLFILLCLESHCGNNLIQRLFGRIYVIFDSSDTFIKMTFWNPFFFFVCSNNRFFCFIWRWRLLLLTRFVFFFYGGFSTKKGLFVVKKRFSLIEKRVLVFFFYGLPKKKSFF